MLMFAHAFSISVGHFEVARETWEGGGEGGLRPLRHHSLIKYAYFGEMLFRTICFYQ